MAQSSKVDFANLFGERSLFQLFRTAPPAWSNRFNTWTTAIVFLSVSTFCVLHICCIPLREALHIQFAETFATWANAGAALAGTILGFLIAGFAIVCTILRPETILALQRISNKTYNMTELKLLFMVFVEIFVQYLALLFWSMAVIVFGGKTGPVAAAGIYLSKIHWLIPFCLLHALFAVWGTWLLFLVLSLKSFVYNLYQSLLLALVDPADALQDQKTN